MIRLSQLLLLAQAVVTSSRANPAVKLDDANTVGINAGLVDKFLGIPFAKSPCVFHFLFCGPSNDLNSVGNLRFRLPEAIDAYSGTIDATSYGPACPQQAAQVPTLDGLPKEIVELVVNTVSSVILPFDEDCELIYNI